MSVYPHVHFLKSANLATQFPPDTGREVAFAGRSNSGKSSAINAIVGRRRLARTSGTPGRTQLINFFELAPGQRLVDLPGYGYARVSATRREHWLGLLDAFFTKRSSLAGLFVTIDVRRELNPTDRQLLEWAALSACPARVLLTKADKLRRGAAAAAFQHNRHQLRGLAEVQLFSATERQGVEEARQWLEQQLEGGG